MILIVIIIIITLLLLYFVPSQPEPSSVLGVPLHDVQYSQAELDQFASSQQFAKAQPVYRGRTPVGKTPTTTTGKITTGGGGGEDENACLAIFNKFRQSQNLPPFSAASQSDIDCANKAAQNDAAKGYHNSFYSKMCPASGQCECSRGVGGGGLANCIQAYISEGPPGTTGAYPQENHGHWNIITGKFSKVACGTDGNGFYTHNFFM